MARVKRGVTSRARHKKIIALAKGYRGRSKNCYRIALQRVEKALQYAYRDRRNRKRDMRALWIQRINAAVRPHGITYGRFIYGLRVLNEQSATPFLLNRKILSDLAVREPEFFAKAVQEIQALAA